MRVGHWMAGIFILMGLVEETLSRDKHTVILICKSSGRLLMAPTVALCGEFRSVIVLPTCLGLSIKSWMIANILMVPTN